ncbi:hypothetical protein ETB97_006794 [Aspergillus alliaceus]|uniref:Uncharacterized protein n=1 Tax=Petromyces alliaceus TaxID=209559 RepID=A0A8H6AGK7_PETAA|nr:hypothetical protein ETB97_006794 [Aspergillus burnettii]
MAIIGQLYRWRLRRNGYQGRHPICRTVKHVSQSAILPLRQAALRNQSQIDTNDSMQGQEALAAILDFAASSAKSYEDLGFMDDDYRCNGAQSRMIVFLILIIRITIAASRLGTDQPVI